MKLVNGKFAPKCSKKDLFVNFVLDLGLICVTTLFILEVIKLSEANLSILILSAILIPILDYIILLSPDQQYTENYRIELKSENSIDGFKLFYRKRELTVSYKIEEGKIIFDDSKNNFTYKDGTKISYLTKQRIINYFSKWLSQNDLLFED